jgi:hypothetical protein
MSALWLRQASPAAACAATTTEAGKAAAAAVAGAAAEAVSAALTAATGGSFELFTYLPFSLTHQLLTMQFPFNLKSF